MTEHNIDDTRENEYNRIDHLIVHSGIMHADDVLVAAMLKELNPDLTVDRARNVPANLSENTLVADIGGGEFDHHQTGAAVRTDGHKHAAYGLVFS